MKKVLSIILFLFLESCVSQHSNNHGEHRNLSPRIFLTSIKKSPCYGECPVFLLNIYESGYAEYKGVKHVELMGTYIGKLQDEQLTQLRDKIENLNSKELNDNYLIPNISDLPSTVIRTKKQNISYHKSLAPLIVKAIEQDLLDIIENITWNKKPDNRNK